MTLSLLLRLFCRYQGGRSYKSFLEFLQKQLENDKVGRL